MAGQMVRRAWRRMPVWLAFGLLALFLNTGSVWAMAQTRGDATTQPTRVAAAKTGAAAVFGIDDGGVISSSDATRALAAATGAYWERISVNWRSLEPTQGTYDFTSADASLTPLINAGFSLIVYLAENPSWAANTPCGPVYPDKVTAFANMLGALAARYPKVKIWAAYNEVDFGDSNTAKNTGGCFGLDDVNGNGIPDYEDYAVMLAAGWKAVHDANSSALFAMGAVAYDNFNVATAPKGYPGGGNGGLFNSKFLPKLFTYMKNNLLSNDQKYIDMLLFNYYDIYGPYWQQKVGGIGILAKAKVLRQLMSKNGVPVVPLFVTESGVSSSRYGVGLNGQARCLTITMVRGAAANLNGVIWWTFKDFADNAQFPQNTWKYGIVDQNLQPKLSYTALQTVANELDGVTFKKNMTNTTNFSGVEAYSFAGNGMTKFVVWGVGIKPSDSTIPECAWSRAKKLATFKAKTLRVVTYLGAVKTIQDNSKKDQDPRVGYMAIKVGNDPLIVQRNP
jgi:GH35 family endo-1,4-beta-xylanase